jgi:hypothetical protein
VVRPHFEFERRNGYVYSNLGVERPDAYSTNFSFVNLSEQKVELIIGFYKKKEHKGKCQYLAGKRCLNRVFDAIGLCYVDRDGPSMSLSDEDVAAHGRGTHVRRERARKVTVRHGANTAALESCK